MSSLRQRNNITNNNIEEKREILIQYRKSIIEFIDELVETLPEEPDFFILRLFFAEQLQPELLMANAIKFVLPMKDMILERNEKFFLEGSHIFGNISSEKVSKFKKIWQYRFDLDTKDATWRWFELFVGLAEKYNSM